MTVNMVIIFGMKTMLTVIKVYALYPLVAPKDFHLGDSSGESTSLLSINIFYSLQDFFSRHCKYLDLR